MAGLYQTQKEMFWWTIGACSVLNYPSGLRVAIKHTSLPMKDESNIKEPCDLSFDGLRSLADELVIAHLRAGHGDALGVLFDRYHRLVIHVALKIIHDVGEAEDVMQNV